MPTTVGGIIKSAMRKIGVLEAGEPLPAHEGDDALDTFRQMVEAWALETLTVPVVNVVIKTMTVESNAYTIGIYDGVLPIPDTHIETARPEQILTAFIRDTQQTDYYLESMTDTIYATISRKVNQSRPGRYYLREGWPSSTILFDSIPYINESLHLEVIQPLSGMLPALNLTEEINLPPGYERTLVNNLCIDLAPEYGKQVPQSVAAMAIDGKKKLKRSNWRDLISKVDRAAVTQRSRKGTYIITQGP